MSDLTRTDKPLCPLQSIGQAEPVPCAGKRCAWWDRLSASCGISCVVEGVGIIADILGTLTEEEIPASDANTDGDEVESMNTSVSYPTIAENGEAVNADGLPERIKVTISREDGKPLFNRDEEPDVVYLTESAPVLVVRRDGGTMGTFWGNAASMAGLLQELVEGEACSGQREK